MPLRRFSVYTRDFDNDASQCCVVIDAFWLTVLNREVCNAPSLAIEELM